MKVRRLTMYTTGPNGQKVKTPTAKFYAIFQDWQEALRRLPLFEDRRASEGLARIVDRLNSLRCSNETLPPDLARAVDEMPAGILAHLAKWDIVKSEKAANVKPLVGHIEDWRQALLAKGGTPAYAKLAAYRVKRIIDGCGFGTVGDVSASKVQRFTTDLRQDRQNEQGGIQRGIGAASFNYYLRDAKSFFRWMVRDGRAFENPLAHLQGVNASMDKRHERRALSPDELRWLLDTTAGGPDRYGMTGPDRAMLYRLAVESGLRAGELRSLTAGSFTLTGDSPCVAIAAAYAKNRRTDSLPLKLETAAMLAKHIAGKMPTATAFAMPQRDRIIDMMKADLADARTKWLDAHQNAQERLEAAGDTFLSYRDDAGRVADFHALRHTFISNLAAGGVHPKTAQRLARHSTITLTMDRYTHLRREDLAGALTVLPDLSQPARQIAVATGTDGNHNVAISLSPSLSPAGAFPRSLVESCGANIANVASEGMPANTGENPCLSTIRAAGIEPARPYGQRILSP